MDYVKGHKIKRVYKNSIIIDDQVFTEDDDLNEVLQMTEKEFLNPGPLERIMIEAWLEGQEERGKDTIATRVAKKRLRD